MKSEFAGTLRERIVIEQPDGLLELNERAP